MARSFSINAREFVAGTCDMTPAEVGAMIRDMAVRWQKGDLSFVDLYPIARRAFGVVQPPAVVQSRRRQLSRRVRDTVLWLAGYRCVYCAASGPLEIDHVIAKSLGGSDVIGNLQALCKPCNLAKAGRPEDEAYAALVTA